MCRNLLLEWLPWCERELWIRYTIKSVQEIVQDNDKKVPEAKRLFRIMPRPDGASLTGNEYMMIQLVYIPLRRNQIRKLGLLVLQTKSHLSLQQGRKMVKRWREVTDSRHRNISRSFQALSD